MIQLFKLAPADQSLCYLQQIFGTMNGIIPTPSSSGAVNAGTCYGGLTSASGSTTLIGTMFQTFNATMLAIGALIIVYVTVVGIMATASEGEFMGKKWKSIWLPIRMVLGIAMLVPSTTGFSAIQMVFMWIIVQGIGAADVLWTTTLATIQLLGSPFVQVTLPHVSSKATIQSLYQGLVCNQTALIQNQSPMPISGAKYYCFNNNDPFCGSSSINIPASSNTDLSIGFGPTQQCGQLTICNPKSTAYCPQNNQNYLPCVICQAQNGALAAVLPTLANIAQLFAQADYQYLDFYYNQTSYPWITQYCEDNHISRKDCVGTNSQLPSPKNSSATNEAGSASRLATEMYWNYFIKPRLQGNTDLNFVQIVDSYITNLYQKTLSDYINSNQNLNTGLYQAQISGWIFAGAYYYTIVNQNNTMIHSSLPTFNFTTPSSFTTSFFQNNRTNYSAAQDLMNTVGSSATTSGGGANDNNTGGGSAGGGGQGGNVNTNLNTSVSGGSVNISGPSSHYGGASTSTVSGPVTAPLNSAQADTANIAGSMTNASGMSAITQMGIAGYALIAVATDVFTILMVNVLAIGIGGFIGIWGVGTGFTNPIGPTAMFLYILIGPAIMALLGLMVSLGGLLAVYVPLIPFIVFTGGVISWFIATIEAMVAAPLVALGILSPSAHGHELLGKAEPALMLIFNIFLRPSLMIFGLIAGMLLASVVISMVNWAFWVPVWKGVIGMGSANTAAGGTAATFASLNYVELIIFICAYVFFLITVINKSFSTIYLIPQQVMQWISGHGAPGGAAEPGEMLAEAKGGVSTGGKGALGAEGAVSGRFGQMDQETKAGGERRGKSGAGTVTDSNTKSNSDKKT